MADSPSLVPYEAIESRMLLIRGHKIMLSPDLARLYGVEPRALLQAVRRNEERFPEDFMFQLPREELEALLRAGWQPSGAAGARSRSQIVILKRGANTKYLPYAFTQEGIAMLSSVLRSPRAVRVNIEIMRAFVRLRQLLASNTQLAKKHDELEAKVGAHDEELSIIFRTLKQLMAAPEKKKTAIGFGVKEKKGTYRKAKGR